MFTLLALGFLYLRQVPVSLSWLGPSVQARLGAMAPGYRFGIGALSALREPWTGTVRVTLADVSVRGPAIAGRAQVGRVALHLREDALRAGRAEIVRAEFGGVTGTVRWSLADLRQSLMKDDGGPPPALPWPAGLDRLKLDDVTLTLIESGGARYRLDRGEVEGTRSHKRGTVRLSAHVRILSPKPAAGRLDVRMDGVGVPQGHWRASLAATAVDPSALASPLGLAPGLGIGGRLDLTGSLEATQHVSARATLRADRLRVEAAKLLDRPVPVRQLDTALVWDGVGKRLRVDRATLAVEAMTLAGGGRVLDKGRLAPDLALAVRGLTPQSLVAYWPRGIAQGGRRWIAANIPQGRLPEARFSWRSMPGKPRPVFGVAFSFEGLEAHYRRPMPPVVGARGEGRLLGSTLRLDVGAGQIRSLDVTGSRVDLTQLGSRNEAAETTLLLSGKLIELLRVLDSEPLRYLAKYDRTVAGFGGTVKGVAGIVVPLAPGTTMDQVSVDGSARIAAGRIPDVLNGRDLQDAALALTVNNRGMRVAGSGRILEQKLSAVWNETFDRRAAIGTVYDVRTLTTAEKLRDVGYDLTDFASGPVDLTARFEGRAGHIARGTLQASLDRAWLTAPGLGVMKAPGVDGEARGALQFTDKGVEVTRFNVATPQVALAGSGHLADDGSSGRFRLDGVQAPGFTGQVQVAYDADKPTVISVSAPSLDFTRLRDFLAAAPAGPATAVKRRADAPVALAGQIDEITLYRGGKLRDLNLSGRLVEGAVERLTLVASAAAANDVRASVETVGTERRVKLEAADAGLIMRSLNMFADGRGGSLTMTGELGPPDKPFEVEGDVRVRNIRVASASSLTRMLTLASLTGIRDAMAGDGILFDRVKAPFHLRAGLLTIKGAHAVGPAMGITLEGQVQQSMQAMDLRGVIVPSYSVNALIGKVPLVGRLIVGGKNEGLVGFNYRIKGPVKQPDIQVSGGSGLALGFLRKIFAGPAPRLKQEKPAEEAPGAPPQ